MLDLARHLRRRRAESGVPSTGASWVLMGMSIASDGVWKKPRMVAFPTRIVAPW